MQAFYCSSVSVKEGTATKRPMKRKSRLPKKRLKLAPLVPQTETVYAKPVQGISTQDVFEQPTTQVQPKKIELKLPELVNTKEGETGWQFIK